MTNGPNVVAVPEQTLASFRQADIECPARWLQLGELPRHQYRRQH